MFLWTPIAGMTQISDSQRHSATTITRDGSAVFGRTLDSDGQARRWTAANGLQDLGGRTSQPLFLHAAVNSDVAYGTFDISVGGFGHLAHQWTVTGGIAALPGFPSRIQGSAITSASEDGSRLTANVTFVAGTSNTRTEAGYWTATDGWVSVQPNVGVLGSLARGMSGDGTTIVGNSTVNQSEASRPLIEQALPELGPVRQATMAA